VLGELTCLTTAVVIMPAVLQQRARRLHPPLEPDFPWDQATAAANHDPDGVDAQR
jgi:hypothetical protein